MYPSLDDDFVSDLFCFDQRFVLSHSSLPSPSSVFSISFDSVVLSNLIPFFNCKIISLMFNSISVKSVVVFFAFQGERLCLLMII